MATKRLIALTPAIDCDQTTIGLPPVIFAGNIIAKLSFLAK
jgi:hypothetical protein